MAILEIVSFQTSRADQNHVRTVVVRSDNMSSDFQAEKTRLVNWAGLNWSDSPAGWYVQSCTEVGEESCDGEGGLTSVSGERGQITLVARYKAEIFPDEDDDEAEVPPYDDKESSSVQPSSRTASKYLFPPKTTLGSAPPIPPPDLEKDSWVTYKHIKTFSTVVTSTDDPADTYADFIGAINSSSSSFLPTPWKWMFTDCSTERISTTKWWVTFRFANAGRGARGNQALYWAQGQTAPPVGFVWQGYDQQPPANIDPT